MRIAAPTPASRSSSPTHRSARRRSSTGWTCRIPAIIASTKGRFVLARNTRYGQERAFGVAAQELIPLPERLYAGGPTSLRGFGTNSAGPRDPETGYPIGGAGALINSTELRLPPPTLPWFGNTLSFVLFHDMGNIFTNASDAWASALRIHQPDRDTCNDRSSATNPTGPGTSTGLKGPCSFNYFSHAAGLGLRYHTPVGPIRLDFSYNLNPPIYPVTYNYSLKSFVPARGRGRSLQLLLQPGTDLLMNSRAPIRRNDRTRPICLAVAVCLASWQQLRQGSESAQAPPASRGA